MKISQAFSHYTFEASDRKLVSVTDIQGIGELYTRSTNTYGGSSSGIDWSSQSRRDSEDAVIWDMLVSEHSYDRISVDPCVRIC